MSGSESAIEVVSSDNQAAISEFRVGSEVEVTSDEEGFEGVWFRATIVAKRKRKKVLVEYYSLLDEEGTSQLKELVDCSYVRPLPPSLGCLSFDVGEVVDTYYRDGWWTGVVNKVLGNSKFRVIFDNPPDVREFHQNQMRVHQDWVEGRWTRTKRAPKMTGSYFSPGNDVEVNLDTEDSCHAWIPAVVMEENTDNTFTVKYHSSKHKHWRTIVDFLHIRPPAPHYADRVYNLHDAVDAFCDAAWRPAEIVTIEGEDSYTVCFQNGTRSKELTREQIRPQLQWKGEKWEIVSEVFREATRKSNSDQKDGLELGPSNVNNCEADLPHEQEGVDIVKDELENGTSLPKNTEKNPVDQCVDINAEPVSCVETPNTTKKTPLKPLYFYRTKRLSKRSENGVPNETLEAAASSLRKWESEKLWAIEACGSSKRLRKPVIPFNFENFTEKKARSKRHAVEGAQTFPAKRKGRPRKNPEKSPEASVVDKAINETNVTPANADEKDAENDGETPVRSTSNANEIKDLLAKVPSQFFSEEMETITVNTKKSDSVAEYNSVVVSTQRGSDPILADLLHSLAVLPNTELEQSQAGRSSKRKRGRPRKLVVLGIEASDGATQQSGVAHLGDKVINACPISDFASPAQATETTVLKEVIKRKKTDVSTSKSSINEGVTIPVGTDDDDRPLSTWLGAMQGQTGTELKTPGKATEQPNKEPQPNPAKDSLAIVVITPEKTPRLPFAKASPIWNVVESLDIFTKMPQTPHFRPLYKCKEECREGLAIGNMVTFSGLVSKIAGLQLDDRNSMFTGILESLADLEMHGFDVSALICRVNDLLSIKAKQDMIRTETENSESKIVRCKDDKTKLAGEIDGVAKKIEELQEKHKLIRVQIEIKDIEISKLQQKLDEANQIVNDARAEFEKLRSAPME